MELIDVGLNIYQAIQDKQHHDKGVKVSINCHQEGIKKSQQHHDRGIHMMKQTYLMELFTTLEQHFQQLNADLIGIYIII